MLRSASKLAYGEIRGFGSPIVRHGSQAAIMVTSDSFSVYQPCNWDQDDDKTSVVAWRVAALLFQGRPGIQLHVQMDNLERQNTLQDERIPFARPLQSQVGSHRGCRKDRQCPDLQLVYSRTWKPVLYLQIPAHALSIVLQKNIRTNS